jgi:hypothetical protein
VTPRAYQLMPHILVYLRSRQGRSSSRAEIRTSLSPIILRLGLKEREHALSFALNYLVRDERIWRPTRGFYALLPKGMDPFTEEDGKRLTDKYEHVRQQSASL